MGNCGSMNKPKETQHLEESKILMNTEQTEKQLDEHYLQNLRLIWFDPNMDSGENREYKKDLDKLFKMKNYANSREDLEAALAAAPDIPIIVISCGGKYEEIGELVENSSQVVMIAIFCFDLQLHLPKLKHHLKIAAVINTFSNLEKELREGYKNFIRYTYKFLDNAEEQTFHELKDQQRILDGQGMEDVFFKGESNITYPLYYKAFHFEEEAWQEALNRILDVANHNDNLCKIKEKEDLVQRIKELGENRSPKDIIYAYTGNGLYPMFGRAFRKGTKELLDLFRLFGFALRGSMGLLGKFIDSEEVLFRGLNLKAEHMKRWEDNLGNIVLLNGYTSTSLDKGLCMTGTFGGNCLMEFRFTKEVEEFEASLDIFNKLWSGYYSPMDIRQLAAYPSEKEILFPPFYPIRILEITPPHLHPDGIFHIVLLAPVYINIGKGGEFIFKHGDKIRKEMVRAYVKRLTILVDNQQITKVDLNQILSNCKGKERKGIFRALGGNSRVQYLNLSFSKTEIKELGYLFPRSFPTKAWKFLNLEGNYFGVKGMEIVALNLKSTPHLEYLNLDYIYSRINEIGDEGVKYLAINLKFVPKLRELDLYINKIGDAGIGSLIEHMECIPNIKDLELRCNPISEGMKDKIKEIAKEKGIYSFRY